MSDRRRGPADRRERSAITLPPPRSLPEDDEVWCYMRGLAIAGAVFLVCLRLALLLLAPATAGAQAVHKAEALNLSVAAAKEKIESESYWAVFAHCDRRSPRIVDCELTVRYAFISDETGTELRLRLPCSERVQLQGYRLTTRFLGCDETRQRPGWTSAEEATYIAEGVFDA